MENKRNHKLPEIGTEEFNNVASQYFGGNSKEKSTRVLALEWWWNINETQTENLKIKYKLFNNLKESLDLPTRIEYIWNREVNGECSKCNQTVANCECHIPFEEKHKSLLQMNKVIPKVLKSLNEKQFKEFNETLFITYINKFSEEDKLNALKVLFWSLNHENHKRVLEIGIDKI
jgi:hypothetical protein